MAGEAAPKNSVTQAIKQVGQGTTSGSTSETKCKDCVKTKLALFVGLTAIGPAKEVGKLPRNPQLLGNVTTVPLSSESAYFVRPPRPGYLYVFKEGAPVAEQWDAYVVGSDGLFRMGAVKNLPADPSQIAHPDGKQCPRPEHNAFSAQFISIDPVLYPKVWIAFSDSLWSSRVLEDYAANKPIGDSGPCRDARMQAFDLKQIAAGGQHAAVIAASQKALEENVSGFKTGDISDADNSCLLYPISRRDGQAGAVAKRMEQASHETKVAGVIVGLNDMAGILAEANWQRQRAIAEKGVYQSEPQVAWKKLSSESIDALRGRVFQRKKAEVVQEKTGKPWTETNDPKLVQKSRELIYKSQFERWKQAGTVSKDAVFQPTTPGATVGHVWVPTDTFVATRAAPDLTRLEEHYDEGKRRAFITEYDDEVKAFDKLIKSRETDWYAWLDRTCQAGLPDLATLMCLDHRSEDRKSAPYYVRVAGACIGTGPTYAFSLPWFKKTINLPLKDEKQVLIRPLFGNQKGLIEWADSEKKDKLYDSMKSVAAAEDLKMGKWMALPVAGYAQGVLTAIGAVAMALNKDGRLDKGLRDALTRKVCLVLKLWENKEVGFLKVKKASIGDLQVGLLAAAFGSGSDIQVSRQTAQAARAAARGRLPAAVANKTIDAILFTVDSIQDIDALLSSLPRSTADQRATSAVSAAEQSLKKLINGTSKAMPAASTRDFVTKLVKRTDSLVGNGSALMAAGVLYLQWFQAVDNLEKVQAVGGPGQLDALLGLGDALFSIMGASAEVYEGVKKAKAIATKQAVTETAKTGVRVAANGFSGIASVFNAVQSFGAAYRRYGEGDADAWKLHTGAGAAFTGAAFASFAMAWGAEATFFGAMLGLGPAGWAVFFTAAAVTLTYAALSAEDSDAEIYLACAPHWVKPKRARQEPLFTSWREEASAFTAIWYGVKLDLNWGDTLTGTMGLGFDKLTMEVRVAETSTTHGWRYRLWVTPSNGAEVVVGDAALKIEAFPSPYANRQTTVSAWDPNQREVMKYHPYTVKIENDQLLIEQTIELDDRVFQQARAEFEYYPDVANLDQYSRLERVTRDDT